MFIEHDVQSFAVDTRDVDDRFLIWFQNWAMLSFQVILNFFSIVQLKALSAIRKIFKSL